MRAFTDLRSVITDLCVMDFGGANHAVQVRSLHPGVSFDEVQDATGFELRAHPEMHVTPPPSADDLRIVRALDPHNLRASVVRNNPAPRRV
jgi:glutaconate CoA-transferase subunit B